MSNIFVGKDAIQMFLHTFKAERFAHFFLMNALYNIQSMVLYSHTSVMDWDLKVPGMT